MKPALSTVACPEWTIDRVAAFAARSGYLGVELRTLGPHATGLTCEPCHTAGEKIRDLFEDAGVEAMCLASNVRFDEPVWPPVLGRVTGDFERPVREVKQLVEIATQMECPNIRVFAFELPAGERRGAGLRRICQRLDLAVRTARHTGVTVLLENGGSFPHAEDLREIIDRIGSPSLMASYNAPVAAAAGDDLGAGLRLLGDALRVVKVSDLRDGRPVPLGHGTHDVASVVRHLAAIGYDGWVVNEHLGSVLGAGPGDADPTSSLEADAESLYGWWREFGGGPIRERLPAA